MIYYLFPFEKVQKGSRIVLYGAGNVGDQFYVQIVETNFCEIVLYLDKNADGTLVKKPEIITSLSVDDYDTVIIAIESELVAHDVTVLLRNYGVPESKILHNVHKIGEITPATTLSRTTVPYRGVGLSGVGLEFGHNFGTSQIISNVINFSTVNGLKFIHFYAGNIPQNFNYRKIGLSLTHNDENHIKHNITNAHDVNDNSVDIYQAEDVFEHIKYDKLELVLKDIYRILKPNGLFRLSVPDYRCDILINRSMKDDSGNIIFDPDGGGNYSKQEKKVINGGHIWFPTIENIRNLLNKIPFARIDYLHYIDEEGKPHCNKIDYTKGFIQRTPDNDERVKNPYRPMSIVVDCYK